MLRMLSDEELAFSAARRAQIPLTEDLYRGVFLPKIRFLKRRRFTNRLRGVLLHLSVESLGRALPERAELLRELVRQQSGFHQYMLDKLARLESNDFGPLNPRVAGVAAWALGTSKITLALAYLVSCLEKLSAGFEAEDATFIQNEQDRARFAKALDASAMAADGAEQTDRASVVARALRAMEGLDTYRSIAVGRDRENEALRERDYVSIEWQCRVAGPDRINVYQAGGRDHDEWITIGPDHYFNLGFWVGPMRENLEPRDRMNAFLRVTKVAALLNEFEPQTATVQEIDGDSYSRLVYQLERAAELKEVAAWMGADSPRAPLHAEVWIDVERGYPAALLLQSEALDWFQIFTGCNEALQIDVPQVSAGPNV